jgi:hypothetical protein
MSATPDKPSEQAPFGPIDHVYAGLRGIALLAGVAYAYLASATAAVRDDVLIAFAVFAAYGTVIYTAGWGWLRSEPRRHRFYALLGAADLAFVVVLMLLTGGDQSPFYRALYLWVAMPAFFAGLRVGTLASVVAFLVFVWFFDPDVLNAWDFLVRAGGLLLHGPVIGYLVDRDRQLLRSLREARRELAEHDGSDTARS